MEERPAPARVGDVTAPALRPAEPHRDRSSQWGLGIGAALLVVVAVVIAITFTEWPPSAAVIAVCVAPVAVLLAVAVVRRPDIGALVYLVTFSIVPVDPLFRHDIRFLSGGLTITDLLLIVSFGSWIGSLALAPRPIRWPNRRAAWLIAGFVGMGLVAVLTGGAHGVQLKFSLLELRAVLALLLVFPVVDTVRRIEEVELGLLVFLAGVVVSASEATRDFILGRGSLALHSGDATRINNLLYVYPTIGIVWGLSMLPYLRFRGRMLAVALTTASAAGLFFTSRRGGWLVALAAPFAVIALIPADRRARIARNLVLLIAVAAAFIGLVNASSDTPITSPLTSARERLTSADPGTTDTSTQFRLDELREARHLIAQHPLTGIGLGATVTFVSPLYDPVAKLSDVSYTNLYLHDSYEWVAVKMGLVGLAVFLALIGVVLLDAYRSYRAAPTPRSQMLLLGGLLTLVAMVLVSFTEPHLTYVGSAPIFAMAIALTQVVPQLEPTSADDRE